MDRRTAIHGLLQGGLGFSLMTGVAEQAWGAPAAAAAGERPNPVGVQLYTVRKFMQSDFEGTLQKVAAIGYTQVEFAGLFGHRSVEVRGMLDRSGLRALSMHVDFESLDLGWDAVLDDAHHLGCRHVIVPAIPAAKRGSLDDYRRAADKFTRCAEAAARANLRFAYHNHDFDFAPLDQRLPFDVLLEATDPKLVGFELDLYWIMRSGQDPLRYFNRWPGRCRLVHVKDSLGGPQHRMTDVGAGIIDWPPLLARARAAGVEHFLVEQDDAAEPFASIATSFSYLRNLKLPTLPVHHGRLKQSVMRRAGKAVPLPELCRRARKIGYDGIDLLYPDEWQIARDAGLTCSMGYASRRQAFMSTGFDDSANHPMLLAEFEAAIPLAAQAGVPNLIAVFGNRRDAAPADAMASCVAGLSQIAPLAEKHGVTICCEGDGTAFGFDVIQTVCSLRVKLLYKIYRMQINDIPWIAHFLTGGVDELDYGALALAIADSGFPGYVAHELPRASDPYNALAHAYRMFDV